MVYDDETGRRVHLSLPLENMKELAARMTDRPTSPEIEAIVHAVKRRARRPNRPKVSPSRVKSDLRRAQHDVSVEQIAWVMVTVMKAPEVITPSPRPRRRQRSRALRWLTGRRD